MRELLEEHLNRISDIRYLSEEEKNKDLNAVVLGRLAAYREIVKFLQEVDLLGGKTKKEEETFE